MREDKWHIREKLLGLEDCSMDWSVHFTYSPKHQAGTRSSSKKWGTSPPLQKGTSVEANETVHTLCTVQRCILVSQVLSLIPHGPLSTLNSDHRDRSSTRVWVWPNQKRKKDAIDYCNIVLLAKQREANGTISNWKASALQKKPLPV